MESRLVRLGQLFVFIGLFGGSGLRSLGQWLDHGPGSGVVLVSDFVSLLFFIGIALWIIGRRRQRAALTQR